MKRQRLEDVGEPVDYPPDPLTEMNERYVVVNEGGRAVVYRPRFDPVLKRHCYESISFEDLKKLYLNVTIQVGRKQEPLAEYWLRSPDRRQFIGGVVFRPDGNAASDELNLWQGFAVTPKKGSWKRAEEHIFRVICRENEEAYLFLYGWMARLVQFPAERAEVAIVLIGPEGTGKGILARILLRILGQHGVAISNPKHLVGSFNAHLRDCVFLFGDECFFAGDKQHTGILKSLITEPYLTVEAKYKNAAQMPNYLHVMLASNENWVVPASLEARRFLVLEVSNEHRGDHDYFEAIENEMENGGYEAMLHELQHYDLTGWNPRAVPETAGLQAQKQLSLGLEYQWWQDVLYRGHVFESELGLEEHLDQWDEKVATQLLYASYLAYAKERHHRYPMTQGYRIWSVLGEFGSG
jgi:Family of unknown function (DUF5906)